MTDPLRRTVHVRVSPDRAFSTWTRRIDLWWPPGHRISGTPDSRIILESGLGGRLFERTVGGRELDYGRVTAWEPPHRLAYDFYLGSSAETPSRVEIRFGQSPRGTRIDIAHHAGALSEARWLGNVGGYARAWDDLLSAITAVFSPTLSTPSLTIPEAP